jgi:hypothetical protein
MKRLGSVVMVTALMVGAVGPNLALAESTTARAGKPQVQVVNIRPEDVGPATYTEKRSFKPDKETKVVYSGGGTTAVTDITTLGKKAGWYTAENTLTRRALVGVVAYSLTVTGEYHSNGKIIDEYGETDWAVNTSITWDSTSERSQWSKKSKSSGTAKASAAFVNEIPSPWGGIQIRKVSESVTESAKP